MIAAAFVVALGVFLAVEAVGPRRIRVRLTEQDQRPLAQRLVDTLFAPAAARMMTAGQIDVDEHRLSLARRLARAGYPEPFTSCDAVLGYRLFYAVLFAIFGGAFCLVTNLGASALPVMAALAVFGWMAPDRTIATAERKRREQLTLDAASTLDRLAIYVAAGNALPAAIRSLAERPGGAWVAEFRKIASAYVVDGDFAGALNEAISDSGRLPEITRVAERIRAAHEMGGGGVAQALRQMAADARSNVKTALIERGYQNAVTMVFPMFLAIVASGIVLIAPGAARMMTAF